MNDLPLPEPRLSVRREAPWRSPRAWGFLIGVTVAGLVVDLASKTLAFAELPTTGGRSELVLADGVAKLRLAWNDGAVFGIGSDQHVFFTMFTIGAIALGLVVFARRTKSNSTLAHVALGLAAAGALGNFYDRLRFGAVRDFIQFLPDHRLPEGATWPGTNNPEMFPWVFNIADVFLLVGLIMTVRCVRQIRQSAKQSSLAGVPPPVPQPYRVQAGPYESVDQAEHRA